MKTYYTSKDDAGVKELGVEFSFEEVLAALQSLAPHGMKVTHFQENEDGGLWMEMARASAETCVQRSCGCPDTMPTDCTCPCHTQNR